MNPSLQCHTSSDSLSNRQQQKNIKLIWCNDNSNSNTNENECGGCRKILNVNSTDNIIGIPTKMEYNPESSQTTYYLKDYFCSFRCCFTILRRYKSYHRIYRSPNLIDCEYMLQLLYKQLYPDGLPLKERPDWRLLNTNNGGPLNEQEFFSDSHLYVDTKSLIISPVKIQYMKLSIN